MNRNPLSTDARRSALSLYLAMVSWALIVSGLAAVVVEYDLYSESLFRGSVGLTAWDQLLTIWVLASEKLFLFAALLAPIGVVLLAGRRRIAWAMMLVLASVLSFLIFADLFTSHVTPLGNHVLYYLRFAQSGAGENAGGSVSRYFSEGGLLLGLTAVFVAGGLWLWRLVVEGTIAGWPLGGGVKTLILVVAIYLALMVGWIPLQGHFSKAAALRKLCAAMPVDLSFLVRQDPSAREFARRFDDAVRPCLDRLGGKLRQAAPVDTATRIDGVPMANRPNIVLIVCESFRADVVEPDTMPGLDAFSRSGLRCAHHYAGSNSTSYGLFGLLYGRSCMTINMALDANVPPQMCATLQASGYRCTYIACITQEWQDIDKFINERTFNRLKVDTHTDWIEGDRRAMEQALRIVQGRDEDSARTQAGGSASTQEDGSANTQADSSPAQPQFVMVFLQCTHTPYRYPHNLEKFQPVTSESMGVLDFKGEDELKMRNRYRNSAAYLDGLIAEFVQKIDTRKRNIVAVTGDHGESFFDDGTICHASRLSEVQTRVPMVMVGPNIPAGVEDRLTTHADLLPTLLHAACGAHLQPVGVSGLDLLAPPGGVPRTGVLLADSFNDPFDLALIRPNGRIRLRLSPAKGAATVLGRLGVNGLLDVESPLNPADAPGWGAALCEQLEQMAGGR